jgi:nucleotide-binding universal stress UspA family protein
VFERILLAFDGSDPSARASGVAIEMAKRFQSELHVCSVIEHLPRYAEETMNDVDEMAEHARQHFELAQKRILEQAASEGVKVTSHIVPGHAVDTIVRLAEQEKVSAIVVGGLGRSHVLHRVGGGTGTRIAYHAPCTVIVVR